MPYGVTEQILEAYAKIIFDLSLNKQVRRGDPIRHLDVETWQAQRKETGLSDAEIADRIGLAPPQVTFIRNVVERRIFRTNQYRKLYRLGGGKRYRPGTFVDPEQALDVSHGAERLRSALSFDPQQVARYINDGSWTNETLPGLLDIHAHEQPDGVAIRAGDTTVSWGKLAARVQEISDYLGTQPLGRGEAVSVDLASGLDAITLVLGALKNGNVVVPLCQKPEGETFGKIECLANVSARLTSGTEGPVSINFQANIPATPVIQQPRYIAEILKTERGHGEDITTHEQGISAYSVNGGDLAFLLATNSDATSLVPHTHHTLLANARGLSQIGKTDRAEIIQVEAPMTGSIFAIIIALWLQRGISLNLDQPDGDLPTATFSPPPKKDHDASMWQTIDLVVTDVDAEKYAAELLLSSETLTSLYRDKQTGPGPNWTPLPGIEVRKCSENNETYELRGPGFAPAYFGDGPETPQVFLPHGWIKARPNDQVRTSE